MERAARREKVEYESKRTVLNPKETWHYLRYYWFFTDYEEREPDEMNTSAIKCLTEIIAFDLLPQHRYFISEHIFWNTTLLVLCNTRHNSPKVSRCVTKHTRRKL
jgi:hypothetical protein